MTNKGVDIVTEVQYNPTKNFGLILEESVGRVTLISFLDNREKETLKKKKNFNRWAIDECMPTTSHWQACVSN